MIYWDFLFVSIGGVPWYIVAELFSQQEISAAVSITGPINWFANFTVGFMFPSMKVRVKDEIFLHIEFVFSCFYSTIIVGSLRLKLLSKGSNPNSASDTRKFMN